jgi:lipid II isoglutaminyl synthase (glutamine-hydrolysing)
MIRLGLLFPEHLNLNGDFGNLEVLSRQLEWRGHAHELVEITQKSQLDSGLNFLLIGHGSEAAWADIAEQFTKMQEGISGLISAGVPVLAVSSGFANLVSRGLVPGLSVSPIADRISKFEIVIDQGSEVLGYVNVDNNLPPIHRSGSLIGTTLHGPILAKNTHLLESVLAQIADSAGETLQANQDAKKAGLLADLVAEVMKLESELANE